MEEREDAVSPERLTHLRQVRPACVFSREGLKVKNTLVLLMFIIYYRVNLFKKDWQAHATICAMYKNELYRLLNK